MNFNIEYKNEKDYYQKIEVEIKLAEVPNQDDYRAIQQAIKTLDTIAQKYVNPNQKEKSE